MKVKLIKNNKGFALLFSVLVSSLLLTIGLSIFSIALKELAISTSARQSIHAFFAADSGREYFLYRDIKQGDILGQTIGVSTTSTSTVNVAGGPYYITEIRRESTTTNLCDSRKEFCTVITSRGYDTDSDDRVERAIEQTY